MRRHVLNVPTALSLVVCLAGILVWGRSYEVGDAVYVTRGLRSFSLISEGGSYTFATSLYPRLYGDGGTWEAYAKRSTTAAILGGLGRFEWEHGGGPLETASLYTVVPQWVVPAVFGPLPAVRFSRWRRRRRLARHRGFEVEPVTWST